MDIRHKTKDNEPKSTIPEKLVNKENPKRDIHVFPQGRGNRQDLLGKLGREEKRELNGKGSGEEEKGGVHEGM